VVTNSGRGRAGSDAAEKRDGDTECCRSSTDSHGFSCSLDRQLLNFFYR
jgi:hypothetical protein